MKIEIKIEVDTDKEQDLEKIEQVLYHIQRVKEILEEQEQNLNKPVNKKRSTR